MFYLSLIKKLYFCKKKKLKKTISIIGSGNLAFHLSQILSQKGLKIDCIYSRNILNANIIAKLINSNYKEISNQLINSDIIIISVADDSYKQILPTLNLHSNSLLLHTSGTNSIDILKDFSNNFGVLYPLQTFSKERKIDFQNIPILIEANSDNNLDEIEKLSKLISNKVLRISSKEREIVHLSAIFCNNFVNYLYSCSEDILNKHNIDFNVLSSLIIETANKSIDLKPYLSQTGPAVRDDKKVISKHKNLLDNNLKEVYQLLTKKIQEKYDKL